MSAKKPQKQLNPFKNVITTGTLAGNDGRKMSKSLGNYTDPNELMDQFSADSYRFTMLASPVLAGEDFALKDKDVSDVARKLSMVWNMYDFFTMYAEVDGWEYKDSKLSEPQNLKNPLDKWVISRLHQTAQHVEKHLDEYNIPEACSEILPFLDDASNWFVRRSRRRFWKSEDDGDKAQAYATLHYVLAYFALIVAPFCPFMAEELWQKMVGDSFSARSAASEDALLHRGMSNTAQSATPSSLHNITEKESLGYNSVHLQNWPKFGTIDEKVLGEMAQTRAIIEKGLAQRMSRDDEFGQIKVRQPLARLTYAGDKLDDFYEQIIAEEVNVKNILYNKTSTSKDGPWNTITLDKKITPKLRREGWAREVIRIIQKARKDAKLNVDDRIVVSLETSDDNLNQAIDEFRNEIAKECLVTKFAENAGETTETKIDDARLMIQITQDKKAK